MRSAPITEQHHAKKNFFHYVDAAEPRGLFEKEYDIQWYVDSDSFVKIVY